MSSEEELLALANHLLSPLHLEASSCEVLQPLWANYGSISRLSISPRSTHPDAQDCPESLILKSITPPPVKGSPSESHLRKLISYDVEQHFYTTLVPQLPASIPVARCIASSGPSSPGSHQNITTIVSDLREAFPVSAEEQRSALTVPQVHAALDWLANFHGFWWTRNSELRSSGRLRLPPLEEQAVQSSMSGPSGVWLNGGYTYLATRQSEHASLQSDSGSDWREELCTSLPDSPNNSSLADLLAIILSPSPSPSTTTPISLYETLLHGDVKSANLFTTSNPASSASAAFFDFQYVGLGLGVCDLAKLFTCSVPMHMLIGSHKALVGGKDFAIRMWDGEKALLERYRLKVEEVSGKPYPWVELERHWNCALVDWLRFQAGWGFWGNTRWLEARVRFILDDEKWMKWVRKTAAEAMEAKARGSSQATRRSRRIAAAVVVQDKHSES